MNPEKSPNNSKEHLSRPEADNQSKRIEKSLEKAAEQSTENKEHKIEQARREIEQHASSEPLHKSETQQNKTESEPVAYKSRGIQEEKYRDTLSEVQKTLPKPQRIFSKVIHAKYVERVSEVAEKTIMRPNIVLGATIGGFLGLLLFYLIAKRFGYELSGFEYFAFVIIGAVLASIFELVRSFIQKVRLRD